MFKKKAVVEFESAIDTYQNSIISAKRSVPTWYKKIPLWKNNKIFNDESGTFNLTIKHCMPFLDSLTIGYMITLPYDLLVKKENGDPYLVWPIGVDHPPRLRNEPAALEIVPSNHYPIEYTWNPCVTYKFPKGYSALFTHPLNRNDLPFTTLSGIIDGGYSAYSHGNIPFYLKKDFEGVIPQGTPIAQLIPFRQENWKLKKKNGLLKVGDQNNTLSGSVIRNWYKNTFWIQKRYE
jgi:hypothetical protein